ncbi:CDGSH iron-sulfur domain-containing protein 3, mitochondrial-like [Penaeus monodon]|uniref:CDGSH iron-sulfur domain-containing protein 3, mitochondrial-like n=1 Tax=Penaeus monodon TaxID=6687 RepID=UPI0018A73B29|nr:CDGSH iron-sulfur domain-containing protein 3, mitochondrial-like [Penaeus monodon]
MASVRSLVRIPFVASRRCLFTGAANLTKADEGGGEAVPERKNKGRIAAKVPARIELKEGKRYLWCACGYSKNQPFCDGTHIWSRWRLKIKQTPVFFKAPATKTYALCTCKQTNKPPYCDGAHRRKEVQEAIIE